MSAKFTVFLALVATLACTARAGCPFMKADGSADSAAFAALLGAAPPGHAAQHGRRLRGVDDASERELQTRPPPPPPPTAATTSKPSAAPSATPSAAAVVTSKPSAAPSATPSAAAVVTSKPSAATSSAPPSAAATTAKPTTTPSATPSAPPSAAATTAKPTTTPSATPSTTAPSAPPSAAAATTAKPTAVPSAPPSAAATTTAKPTLTPSAAPTTLKPTATPTAGPTTTNVGYVAPRCAKTNGAAVTSSKAGTCVAYKTLKALFPAITPTNPTAQARFYGSTVRLAFHDAGEVNLATTDAMGPDGCLNTANTDNAGLLEASSPVFSIIEPLWQTVCDQITRADFWALVAKTVVETADATHTISIPYQYGRKDNTVCTAGSGRLPSAQGGVSTINQVFVTQMGLTLNDAVTLIGAHTLGHVHTQFSGYGFNVTAASSTLVNAWDNTPTVFDNQYYQSMLNIPWGWNQPNGPSKSLFKDGPNQVMLGTDMVLGFPADTTTVIGGFTVGAAGQVCGPTQVNGAAGCTFGRGGTSSTTLPSTYALAASYATNNALFLTNFATSFAKMTSVGYGVPANVDGATASGKLGTLTAINLATC